MAMGWCGGGDDVDVGDAHFFCLGAGGWGVGSAADGR